MKPKLSKTDDTVMLSIKIPAQLKDNFFAVAAKNDQSVSQLIRAFARDYIKKYG